MDPLRIELGDFVLRAHWIDENAEARATVAASLPVEGRARRWGDELYLPVDITATPTETREAVDPGTVAYWPDGPALCVFWGPTPASTDDRPRAASPVGVLATLDGFEPLHDLDGGTWMRVVTDRA